MKKLALALTLTAAVAMTPAAFAYEGGAVSNGGTISGTVKLDGAAAKPKKVEITKDKEVCGLKPHVDESLVVGSGNGVEYAIVTISDINKGAPLKPSKDVKFDQKGCDYLPHVLAFPAGSSIQILNSDGILHNIHTDSKTNTPVNMAQPKFKKVMNITVDKPELFKVNCDAHGWMHGWWYAAGNPYYAVTDEKGNFTIKDVPAGNYTVKVWQEKLAPAGSEASQKVSVKAGATSTADFSLKPKS